MPHDVCIQATITIACMILNFPSNIQFPQVVTQSCLLVVAIGAHSGGDQVISMVHSVIIRLLCCTGEYVPCPCYAKSLFAVERMDTSFPFHVTQSACVQPVSCYGCSNDGI